MKDNSELVFDPDLIAEALNITWSHPFAFRGDGLDEEEDEVENLKDEEIYELHIFEYRFESKNGLCRITIFTQPTFKVVVKFEAGLGLYMNAITRIECAKFNGTVILEHWNGEELSRLRIIKDGFIDFSVGEKCSKSDYETMSLAAILTTERDEFESYKGKSYIERYLDSIKANE